MHMVQKQVAQREKPSPGRDIRRRQGSIFRHLCPQNPMLPKALWQSGKPGLLDTVAYFLFFLGTAGEDAAMAACSQLRLPGHRVLLGWLFLEEKVSLVCWSGKGLVFSGIALLSALR